MAEARTGAYGFRLDFASGEPPRDDLVVLDDDTPLVRVQWRLAAAAGDVEEVAPGRVRFGYRGGSIFDVRRDPPEITLDLFEEPPREAIVHPVLTVPLSMLARWRGDATVHAGAIAVDGAAWGLVGVREAGKSTMLASLARRGLPVVADDLLTVQGDEVWAGLHCVDLRPDAATRFDGARFIGTVAGRDRYRLSTAPSPARLPLRGFFALEWSDESDVAVMPMPAREVMSLILAQEYIALMGMPDSLKLLELTARPAYRVRRPRDWAATDATLDAILAAAAQG